MQKVISLMNRLFAWKIDVQLLIWLIAGFILATVIGTISHEFGHYIVARVLGYEARINYAATSWRIPDIEPETIYRDSFHITSGGPLQTMLTGTIGLILCLSRRSFLRAEKLTAGQWVLIFITLFWLRQAANFTMWVASYVFTGEVSTRADEIRMALYPDIPYWSVISITGITGLVILAITIFRFVPKAQRLTFILSGMVGGVAGYILWLESLGKIIMP